MFLPSVYLTCVGCDGQASPQFPCNPQNLRPTGTHVPGHCDFRGPLTVLEGEAKSLGEVLAQERGPVPDQRVQADKNCQDEGQGEEVGVREASRTAAPPLRSGHEKWADGRAEAEGPIQGARSPRAQDGPGVATCVLLGARAESP